MVMPQDRGQARMGWGVQNVPNAVMSRDTYSGIAPFGGLRSWVRGA